MVGNVSRTGMSPVHNYTKVTNTRQDGERKEAKSIFLVSTKPNKLQSQENILHISLAST